jgi:hypothetical protein
VALAIRTLKTVTSSARRASTASAQNAANQLLVCIGSWPIVCREKRIIISVSFYSCELFFYFLFAASDESGAHLVINNQLFHKECHDVKKCAGCKKELYGTTKTRRDSNQFFFSLFRRCNA